MNNHDFEMCCGTTCDKQEYVARLERENGDMVDRIALLESVIDDAHVDGLLPFKACE